MGCSFYWEGPATEEQQRLSGWFLESLFDADENGVSQYFPEFMICDTYNGPHTGYFYEIGSREANGPLFQTVHLIGTSIRSSYYVDSEPDSGLWATDQLSFVFLKNGENLGELITFEPVADITKRRYERIRAKFDGCDASVETPLAIFNRGGRFRLLTGESSLPDLLYAIKRLCVPGLLMSDDYLLFSATADHGILHENFTRSLLRPDLAENWGFDPNNLDPIFARIDSVFNQNNIKNLGLSNAAIETLIGEEVLSLSDITFITKDWFVNVFKPTPEVLIEIEEAMDRLGHSFKPGPPVSDWADNLDDDFPFPFT